MRPASPSAQAAAAGLQVNPRLGSRWASTLATTATAALGVVLTLIAVSGPQVAIHGRDDGPQFGSRRRSFALAEPPTPEIPAARPDAASRMDAFTLRNPPSPGAPYLTGVAGPGAAYGHKVTLRGHRLGNARAVTFIGVERGRADARFVVWDDDHLIASVPDLGAWPQDVVIAVTTDEGVAVTLPRDATICDPGEQHNPPGGVVIVPRGSVLDGGNATVVFVENNAAARAGAGMTAFVRSGGTVWGRSDCSLFCEPGVVPPGDVYAHSVERNGVNPCVVASLFHYTAGPTRRDAGWR